MSRMTIFPAAMTLTILAAAGLAAADPVAELAALAEETAATHQAIAEAFATEMAGAADAAAGSAGGSADRIALALAPLTEGDAIDAGSLAAQAEALAANPANALGEAPARAA